MSCESCDRKQETLDACRELLRTAGVEGFGSLMEGIKLSLQKPLRPVAFHVPEEVVGEMARTMAKNVKMVAADRYHLYEILLELEICRVVCASFCEEYQIPTNKLIEDVKQHVKHTLGLKHVEALKRKT